MSEELLYSLVHVWEELHLLSGVLEYLMLPWQSNQLTLKFAAARRQVVFNTLIKGEDLQNIIVLLLNNIPSH